MTAIYKTNTVNCPTLTLTDPQVPCPVAYITLTDLVIGDFVSITGAVEVTTEESYNALFGRYAKVDTTTDTNTANGDLVCRAMAGHNIQASPGHHAMLTASGFYQVTRNGSAESPHVFMLVAYCASSSAAPGDTVVVNYVELHLKVN